MAHTRLLYLLLIAHYNAHRLYNAAHLYLILLFHKQGASSCNLHIVLPVQYRTNLLITTPHIHVSLIGIIPSV